MKETLRRCGASGDECGRLQYALTCLRKVTGLGTWGLPPSPLLGLVPWGLWPSPWWVMEWGKRGQGFWGSLERPGLDVHSLLRSSPRVLRALGPAGAGLAESEGASAMLRNPKPVCWAGLA